MIRPLCRMGNPILRDVAQEIELGEIVGPSIQSLVEDLRDSMKHYAGIGIAAPQVGVSLQICVIELNTLNRYGEEIHLPFTVFINPKIEFLTSDVQGYWEGCLSVPGLRGFVERPRKIRVNYFDQNGHQKVIEAEGFLATVIQHELDHLFGKLYIDRIIDTKFLSYQEEFEQFIQSKESID